MPLFCHACVRVVSDSFQPQCPQCGGEFVEFEVGFPAMPDRDDSMGDDSDSGGDEEHEEGEGGFAQHFMFGQPQPGVGFPFTMGGGSGPTPVPAGMGQFMGMGGFPLGMMGGNGLASQGANTSGGQQQQSQFSIVIPGVGNAGDHDNGTGSPLAQLFQQLNTQLIASQQQQQPSQQQGQQGQSQGTTQFQGAADNQNEPRVRHIQFNIGQQSMPDGSPANPLQALMQAFTGQGGGPVQLNQLLLGMLGPGAGQAGDYIGGRDLQELMNRLFQAHEGGGNPPASEEAIASLPEVRVSQAQVGDQLECPICKDEFELDAIARQMPCSHVFHGECISKWLSMHNACPVCRAEIPIAEGTAGSNSTTTSSSGGTDTSARPQSSPSPGTSDIASPATGPSGASPDAIAEVTRLARQLGEAIARQIVPAQAPSSSTAATAPASTTATASASTSADQSGAATASPTRTTNEHSYPVLSQPRNSSPETIGVTGRTTGESHDSRDQIRSAAAEAALRRASSSQRDNASAQPEDEPVD